MRFPNFIQKFARQVIECVRRARARRRAQYLNLQYVLRSHSSKMLNVVVMLEIASGHCCFHLRRIQASICHRRCRTEGY
jgi:hypothetical protein